MKKVILAMMILGSFSTFASTTLTASFSVYSFEAPLYAIPNSMTPSDRGQKIQFKANLENAHAFCISKGYKKAETFTESNFEKKYIASKITPTAEVAGTTSPIKSKFMDSVRCERDIL